MAPVVDSFYPIIVGSFVTSIGHVMTQQSQNILINKWFGDNERALAVSISTAGLPFGSLIGFVCTGVSFNDKDALAINQLDKLIAGQNIAISCICVLFYLTFKSEPEHPPSAVALKKSPIIISLKRRAPFCTTRTSSS